jgi:hypothetical protein
MQRCPAAAICSCRRSPAHACRTLASRALSLTFSTTNTRPRMSWPVEWPKPQSAPRAEAAARLRPMVSGVSACRGQRGRGGGSGPSRPQAYQRPAGEHAAGVALGSRAPQATSIGVAGLLGWGTMRCTRAGSPPGGRARRGCAGSQLPGPPRRSWPRPGRLRQKVNWAWALPRAPAVRGGALAVAVQTCRGHRPLGPEGPPETRHHQHIRGTHPCCRWRQASGRRRGCRPAARSRARTMLRQQLPRL